LSVGERETRKRQVQEAIERSPANRESVYHDPKCGEDEKNRLRELRKELARL